MKGEEKIYRILRHINTYLCAFAGILIIIASIITSYDVVMRYGYAAPTTWAGELASFMMVYVVFLGLGFAMQNGAHVSVDLFLEWAGEGAQWLLGLLGGIIVLVFGVVLTWQTTALAYDSYKYSWVSSSMLAMPLKYIYFAGPLGSALFTLTSVFTLIRRIAERPGKKAK